MREISLETEVMVLKSYIDFYNTHKEYEYTKEQLYKDYYGMHWEHFYNKKSLDKYLVREAV